MGVGEELMKIAQELQRGQQELQRGQQELHAKVDRLLVAKPVSVAGPSTASDAVASDEELNGPKGDKKIKLDPSTKKWSGPSYKGQMLSQCPSEYLEALAGLREWQANRDEQQGNMDWVDENRREARLARGWARRNRQQAQQSVSQPAPPPSFDAFDEVPF